MDSWVWMIASGGHYGVDLLFVLSAVALFGVGWLTDHFFERFFLHIKHVWTPMDNRASNVLKDQERL